LRRRGARARFAGRHRRPAPLRLLDLPAQRRDRRVRSAGWYPHRSRCGRVEALPVQYADRTALFLLDLRHLYASPASLESRADGYNVGCLEGVNPFDLLAVPTHDGVNHPADRAARR
jgi:hypothetical protein